MKKFKLYAGLGGSFGGARYVDTDEFESESDACDAAWEMAREIYEGYVGLHGIRSIEDIAKEEGLDLNNSTDVEYLEEIFNEERESWIDYYVKEE